MTEIAGAPHGRGAGGRARRDPALSRGSRTRSSCIVRRPAENEREVIDEGVLDLEHGLVGDRWRNGFAKPDTQVTLMNARADQA